ncbi:MAG: energy transducer TonB [Rhodothalassiaceae bacterium]
MTRVTSPFLSVLLASVLVTGLVWLMITLIQQGEAALDTTARKPTMILFSNTVEEKAAAARVRRLPQPPKPNTDPVADADVVEAVSAQEALAVMPDLLANLEGGSGPRIAGSFRAGRGVLLGSADLSVGPDQNRGMTPLVRVAPMYPLAARMRKVEGSVIVEFDITAEGHTANAKVVSAEPPGFFEKAALDAIAKWRYRPRMIDGQAVPVSNIYVSLAFKQQTQGTQAE